MKVGLDAKRVFHNFRGLGNYSRTLIESLDNFYSEHQYYLYTTPYSDKRAMNWEENNSNCIIKTPKTSLGKALPSFWRTFQLKSDLEQDNLDIYHGLTHELPYGIDKLNLLKVVTIHDLIFLRYPDFFPWIDRQVYFKKFKYSCKNADIIISICQQTKDDLIHFLNVPAEKIKVVYQSCSPHFYDLAVGKNEILKKYFINDEYILYVGAIEERKNVLNLVRAYKKTNRHEKLVLIGSGGQYLDKVKNEIKLLKLESKVIILNSVPFSDLPVLYQSAKLFCFPSLFEGFGIPIIEALFSKTPVLTSKGSCFPESGGPSSMYIDPLDSNSIASGIIKVLSDNSLAEEMKINGF
ncbi:MAG: glycosyltransferase family 4 protein, partial [Bdellovibrionales bacterium]|nr:glycosyltransferase family 4 protein [Bdellovibrionales bacterium]